MEEFNACLKRSRFCKKIKDFTLVSDACHQNIEGKSWCLWPRFDFLTNQRLFFLEVKLYRSSSFNKTVLWYLLWQDQVVLGEISRPHGERLLTSFESLQYMPVIKATSTRTSKKNIQWWKILPSSDKEITPYKSSLSLGHNLRKQIVFQRRIVLVLLTAVDLQLYAKL